MRFCRQMNNRINGLFFKKFSDEIRIRYIALDKLIVGSGFNIGQVGQVACIG